MILHVVEAEYVRGYIIRVKFNDGADGLVDLTNELHGKMFEPLRNVETFGAFKVDPELETIVWENGADFAPEFLHDRLLVPAEPAHPDDP